MKPAALAFISTAFLATAAFAAPAMAAPEVKIEDAVARVVVIVEDRTDVGVEIVPGSGRLPAPHVTRRGDRVRIDGGLNRIRNCRPAVAGTEQPGDGASVEVRDFGRVELNDAPLIVIRSPRNVDVSAEGAVFGSVGRGASSVDLTNGGCGDWTVANVDGPADVTMGGSGALRMGASHSLDVVLGGSGSMTAGTTGNVDLTLGGSGEATIAAVNGEVDLTIGGSGKVAIRGGRAPKLSATIGGSGDVDFAGTAGDVDVTIAGSGNVRVGQATGHVSRTVMGSGDIVIGR